MAEQPTVNGDNHPVPVLLPEIWSLIILQLAVIQPIKPAIKNLFSIGMASSTLFQLSNKFIREYLYDWKHCFNSLLLKFQDIKSLSFPFYGTAISFSCLQKMTNLTELDTSFSDLPSECSLSSLPYLENLVSLNDGTDALNGAYSRLSNLTKLGGFDLNNHQIFNLPHLLSLHSEKEFYFSSFQKLKQFNNLTSLHISLSPDYGDGLQYLHLFFPHLISLGLINEHRNVVPVTISSFQNLISLELYDLTTPMEQVFFLTNIKTLDIHMLGWNEEIFHFLTSIESLTIISCPKIKTLEVKNNEWKKLKELNLYEANLSLYDESKKFTMLTCLRFLYDRDLPTRIPSLSLLTNLKKFEFSTNLELNQFYEITFLDKLTQIEDLALRTCNLSHESLMKFTELTSLDVPFRSLYFQDIQLLPYLKDLNAQNGCFQKLLTLTFEKESKCIF